MPHQNEPRALEFRALRAIPSDKVISSAASEHRVNTSRYRNPAGLLSDQFRTGSTSANNNAAAVHVIHFTFYILSMFFIEICDNRI